MKPRPTLPSLFEWIWKTALNLFGLFLCGLGIVLAVQCGLGANPWDTFQLGMMNYLPISLGQASQIIAFTILIFNLTQGVIPGVGTLLNAYFIGFFIDLIYRFSIQTPDNGIMKWVMLLISLIAFGFGIVLSLKAKIGVGSRDALMEFLITHLNISVRKVRAGLEIFAVVGSLILGGPLGIGTLVAALSLGYFISYAAKVCRYDFDIHQHYTLQHLYLDIRSKLKGEPHEKYSVD